MLEVLFLVYSTFSGGVLYAPGVTVGAADRGWHLIVGGGQDLLRYHTSRFNEIVFSCSAHFAPAL